MMGEQVITHARIVTGTDAFPGSAVVRNGSFVRIDDSPSQANGAIDFEGDLLLPGFVELHTDNLEKHFRPRPGVRWPSEAAVLAHDAQMAAAGITTVLDALRIGDFAEPGDLDSVSGEMSRAIHAMQDRGALRCHHHIHVRCEISAANVVAQFEPFMADALVRLVSLMDHTPGQRQFVDIAKYRQYFQGKHGLTDAQMEAMIASQRRMQETFGARNREALVAACREIGLAIASHDDATEEHVLQAAAESVVISEFPTTETAAKAARDYGLRILMGAPNIVLGGSHSGNVSADWLARRGLLDILSSDYVPSSLLHGALMLTRGERAITLPEAIAKISLAPANAAGLTDRGEIAVGKRADLVRVRVDGDHAVIRAVWRAGERIV